VLISGGRNLDGELKSCVLYDEATETFSATGAMGEARYAHTATLLPNGKVLVVGGYAKGSRGSAELYDPATGAWTSAGVLTTARTEATAVLLGNGEVLVTGGKDETGRPTSSAEIWNEKSGWRSAGDSLLQTYGGAGAWVASSSTIKSARVVFAGGGNSLDEGVSKTVRYDPEKNLWEETTTMKDGRKRHRMLHMGNGTYFVTGGHGRYRAVRSTESYTPTMICGRKTPL
jgi:N-acetylneuraminic acid mutarotase